MPFEPKQMDYDILNSMNVRMVWMPIFENTVVQVFLKPP